MEVAKITPDELMRGNYVLDRGGKVLQIDHWEYHNKISEKREPNKHPLTEYVEYLQPIPITEDWLIKLGFDYYPENKSYQLDTNLGFKLWGRDGIINIYSEYSEQIGEDMLFIHQIQNCVFALTQQPLTIKK